MKFYIYIFWAKIEFFKIVIFRLKMYPSSSGAGHNPTPPRRGVNAALEPVQEWTIKEILFDGVEKRVKYDTHTIIFKLKRTIT